jgi:hypothetical protein
MGIDTIHSDRHCAVRFDHKTRVFSYVRTAAPFATTTELRTVLGALENAVDLFVDRARGLLFDARLAPLRTDPEFEAITKLHFDPQLLRFARVAVLVATATGKLQVNRVRRERSITLELFDDEPRALAFLLA